MSDESDLEAKNFLKKGKRLFRAVFLAAIFLIFLFILVFGSKIPTFSNFQAALGETFSEVFGFREEKPMFELSLSDLDSRNLSDELGLSSQSDGSNSGLVLDKTAASNSAANLEKDMAQKQSGGSGRFSSVQATGSAPNIFRETNSNSNYDSGVSNVKREPGTKSCAFSGAASLSRKVSFNEIAWMGGASSPNDEWFELKNNFGAEIDLANWQIKNFDESIKVIFGEGEKIFPASYFLLERTDDNSVPGVSVDKVYIGALSNDGELLGIFDQNCNLVDQVDARAGWKSFGGDNETKKTLERDDDGLSWHASAVVGGTPRTKNSEPMVQAPSSTPPQSEPPPSPPVSPPPAGSPTSTLPSEPPPPPPPPDQTAVKVLISEVMAGSSISSDYEFLEIYNYGNEAVDLTGWTIKKKSSTGSESSLVATSRLNGKTIPAGKYFLLAHDGGYTGSVAADVVWPASYSLAYTNNSITIYNASGAIIDQVSWAEIPKDKSYSRTNLDISAGFAVTDSPSPTNSQ